MSIPNKYRPCSCDQFEQIPNKPIPEQLLLTLKSLQGFREKSIFTDVIIFSGNEEFSCHKAVLAASSNYFYTMFSSPYKEQQTSRVNLNHISPWALRHLLDFAYLGVLKLLPSTIQDVFTAATLLDYPLAIRLCVSYMEDNLDISNCLGIELLAEAYGLTHLERAAHKMATDNFSSLLAESTEWVELPFKKVVSYISSNDLNIGSEKVVWDALVNWVDHDPDLRSHQLSDLVRYIRLNCLGSDFLMAQLNKNALVLENKTVQSMIKCALNGLDESVLFKTEDNSSLCSSLVSQQPRPATLKKPALIVLGGLNTCVLNCMQSFTPPKYGWQTCPSLPVDNLVWFSASVVGNTLFVTGGIKAGIIADTVYAYSPNNQVWTQKSPMIECRARHSSVAVGNRFLYLFGGLTLTTDSGSIETTSAVNNSGDELRLELTSDHVLFGNPVQDYLMSSLSPNSSSRYATVKMARDVARYDVCNDTWLRVGETDKPRLESCVVIIDELNAPPHSDSDSDQISLNRSEHSFVRANSNSLIERTFVEIGGITELQSQGLDQIALYRLNPDFTVSPTADYIKLPQSVRYVNCSVKQGTDLLYIFWELNSELSVFDLHRHTLRSLAPLPPDSNTINSNARIHSGLAWVNEELYVVGGFSQFVGDHRRPITPRDDVHRYDPASNTWSLVDCSPTTIPRAIFGCVCLST